MISFSRVAAIGLASLSKVPAGEKAEVMNLLGSLKGDVVNR